MGQDIRDCLSDAFYMLFGRNIPKEITPRDIKDMKTELNRLAEERVGHQFPKKILRENIEYYLKSRTYEKEFVKNYQALNRPQWVYRLPK